MLELYVAIQRFSALHQRMFCVVTQRISVLHKRFCVATQRFYVGTLCCNTEILGVASEDVLCCNSKNLCVAQKILCCNTKILCWNSMLQYRDSRRCIRGCS